MPDDVERPAIPGDDGPKLIDVLDNAYAFEREFKRKPTGWADYCYGMAHLGRAHAHEMLRNAGAFRASQTVNERDWKDWLRDTRTNAGI